MKRGTQLTEKCDLANCSFSVEVMVNGALDSTSGGHGGLVYMASQHVCKKKKLPDLWNYAPDIKSDFSYTIQTILKFILQTI